MVDQFTSEYNNTPQEAIGGFSPNLLFTLERHPLGTPGCPIHLADNLPLAALEGALYFNRIRTFLHALRDAGRVKATQKGNLTRGFVEQMVDAFLDPSSREEIYRYQKVLNEEDLFPLHSARLICKICNLIGITKGHYNVRKKALPLLESGAAGQLYKQLFLTFFTRYNIGYGFRYGPDLDWLQFEAGYVLKPLQDKGGKWLSADELCQTLLHPMVLSRLQDELREISFMTPLGTMERHLLKPFEHWGLVEIERHKKGHFSEIKRLRKTRLLDAFISFPASGKF